MFNGLIVLLLKGLRVGMLKGLKVEMCLNVIKFEGLGNEGFCSL